jgi:hypothetical protein
MLKGLGCMHAGLTQNRIYVYIDKNKSSLRHSHRVSRDLRLGTALQ